MAPYLSSLTVFPCVCDVPVVRDTESLQGDITLRTVNCTEFYGLAKHPWKQPRENSCTSYVTHTLCTQTGYAHMETQL